MSILERAIRAVAPGLAVARERNRRVLDILQTARYDAATSGNRGKSWRPTATDADAAAAQRARLAFVARDMIRNTAFATRAQSVIANNVVGDGIIPKITGGDKASRARLLDAITRHFDTTDIDAAGRCNLYGLQRLATNTMVEAGEVLIRRRPRDLADGFAMPVQIEMMEPDYLDTTRGGVPSGGNSIRDGIEYDLIGRRVAYHLFHDHPGASGWGRLRRESRRVPASEILHLFRQDRPGQNRGVSWFAPIAMQLQDMADHQDAQLMRQKIAACFTAFVVSVEADAVAQSDGAGPFEGSIMPGRIQSVANGSDVKFAVPPGVQGYDEFTRWVMRAVAAGLGITYEALTGDLSRVNFSSARMGRMEMDRNVSAWQWLVMVPGMCQPIGRWALDGWRLQNQGRYGDLRLEWVPPYRALVDPAREIPALGAKVRQGFTSRSSVIRELGFDPEIVAADIARDNQQADALGFVFDSDPRRVSNAGVTNAPVDGAMPAEEGMGDEG